MSTSLDRRLAALESLSGSDEGRITAILRTFVEPGPGGPVKADPKAIISEAHGWRIEREAGESIDAFITRVIEAAPQTVGGVTRLVEELG